MNERELKRLRAQVVADYQAAKAKIEADYKKRLDALDLVWRMSGEGNGYKKGAAPPGFVKGDLQAAVREVVGTFTTMFTVKDVLLRLNATKPDLQAKPASVSSTLKRMANTKEITLISTGAGKRPSTFVTPTGTKAEGAET